MDRIRRLINIVGFFGIFYIAWLIWWLYEAFIGSSNNENRDLASFPSIRIVGYQKYTEELDCFFEDHIPFRNLWVTINNGIDYFIFSKATDERVIIGKEGWLFYDDKTDGDPIACYKGTNLFSEDILEEIAANCINNRDYLKSIGKEFVIMVIPNKERVYPEFMPDKYGLPADTYRALQVIDYLKANTDLRIVYVYDDLMEAKSVCKKNLFFKSDTHWNNVGSYVGSKKLCEELGIEMPSIDNVVIETDGAYYKGDLAKILSIQSFVGKDDPYYMLTGYSSNYVQELNWDFQTYFEYEAKDADKRSLYMIRDSFASNMSEYLGSQFSHSYYVYRPAYEYENMISFNPDIVVFETAERYISTLRGFKIVE